MKYQIINHGPEHEQYFPGCGTFGTPYSNVATGISWNAKLAYQDAVEQAVEMGADPNLFSNQPRGVRREQKLTKDQWESGEWHWYVSVRW